MRQQVDPFIPVSRRPRLPDAPYGQQYLKKPSTASASVSTPPSGPTPTPPVAQRLLFSSPRVVDGIIAPRPSEAHRRSAGQQVHPVRQTPQLLPRAAKTAEQSAPAKARRQLLVLQLVGVILVAVGIGLFIQTLVFGELTVAAYAVYALVRRTPSRNTFMLALVALCVVVLLFILHGGGSGLSDNFAVYTFLLMLVGTISLGVEVHRGDG